MTAPVSTENARDSEHRREIANALNQVLRGQINTVSELTIANGTTSTAVADVNAHMGSMPILMPTNATGAALIGSATGVYVSSRGVGTFTLTHPNPGASATFLYALLG